MDINNVNFFLKGTLLSTPFDIDEKHIQAVERIIRVSLEYRSIIADKRENENENSCEFLKQFDFSDKRTTLELHHVITLYDICKAAAEQLIDEKRGQYATTFDVANRVMEWHYKGAFLYVFLSKSVHQLVHNGQYEVPKEHIKGNPKLIKSLYYSYLDESNKTLLDELLKE